MQNIVKLPVIPWICFVDVPFHCLLLSVKQANHKQQNKMVLLKIHHLTSPNHSDPGWYAGSARFIYKKSCGSQLFWDALDVVCTENDFDNWNLLK